MKPAEGLTLEALKLEEFIKFFKPTGWVGPIHDFDFIPYISDADIKIILEGKFPEDMKYGKWYVKEAIASWLKQRVS